MVCKDAFMVMSGAFHGYVGSISIGCVAKAIKPKGFGDWLVLVFLKCIYSSAVRGCFWFSGGKR
jgi:hypothetical protein